MPATGDSSESEGDDGELQLDFDPQSAGNQPTDEDYQVAHLGANVSLYYNPAKASK